MRKFPLVFLMMVLFFCLTASVFTEQDPCTADSFGCWVPAEGGKTYIRYWDAKARLYIENADFSRPDLVLFSPEAKNSAQ